MSYGSKALSLAKYPGAKSYQIKYLYGIFNWVDCDTFIDGCAGMGSVSLNLPKGIFSKIIVNDKDSYINNVWQHFHDAAKFAKLKKLLLKTQYSLDTYWKARKVYCGGYKSFSKLEIAWATLVSHRMSRNAMPCNMFQQAGRLRGGQNECVNAWQSYLKTLDSLHNEVKTKEIWNEDVCNIVGGTDDPRTLIYLDVPYPLNTRVCKMYRTEMTDKKHGKLLSLCRNSKCKIAISGRPNELYEYMLHDWQCETRTINNNMSHKKGVDRVKTPEVVWTNFEWVP